MSFENGLFTHETTDMFAQIEACQWDVTLFLLEAEFSYYKQNAAVI